MTKLTHHHHHHQYQQYRHHHHHHCHKYTTPQHEDTACCCIHTIDHPLSPRKFSIVHRSSVSPSSGLDRIEEGYATGLSIIKRLSSERDFNKAEEISSIYRGLHDDVTASTFDFDRMSDHEPSSGDGDEEAPSPEDTDPYLGQAPWPTPSLPTTGGGGRPASSNQAGGPKNIHSKNTKLMSGDVTSSSKAVQPTQGRHVVGQFQTALPAEKVFPIQVGTETFRLSGASISSDGPSYFTQFFEDQIRQNEETGGVRTLYIDRDTDTFRDIVRHLQGYYVKPRDGAHFVRLFADAQFYSLPRLISQLFESEIFIQIGEEHFQIPKDIFSDPGNSPNFFSLGFAVFFSTPSEAFPGLDRRGLLRPPPINPPHVPSRSARVFQELLHLLRGYPINVRDETHRQELLRDCRYFHLRGLEQRIIAHDISYNLKRQISEIVLGLNDLKPSGISYRPDEVGSSTPPSSPDTGWVYYARPFVDEEAYELIVEIGGESTVLDLEEMRVDFHGRTKARVASLFQVIANKMGLPSNQPLGLIMLSGGASKRSPSPSHSPLSEDKVRVRFDTSVDILLDNQPFDVDWESAQGIHMRTGAIREMNKDEEMDEFASVLLPPAVEESKPPVQLTVTNTSRTTNPKQPGKSGSGTAPGSSSTAVTTISTKTTRNNPRSAQAPSSSQRLPPSSSSAFPNQEMTYSSSQSNSSTTSSSSSSQQSQPPPPKKRKVDVPFSDQVHDDQHQQQQEQQQHQQQQQQHSNHKFSGHWTIRQAQWRIRVEASTVPARAKYEIVFVAVKIDAFTGEKARNGRRGWLG